MSAVNVNLSQYCDAGIHCRHVGGHGPLPIPCPIPRSVTMTVRLGECTCKSLPYMRMNDVHADTCPALPIRVACSIGGETWADSFIEDAWPEKNDGYLCSTGEEFPTLLDACRARWEIVNALVTGRHSLESTSGLDLKWLDRVFSQRDAVFAALADMARAEEECLGAEGRLSLKVVGHTLYWPDGATRPSQVALGRYVEHLIEQVGAL